MKIYKVGGCVRDSLLNIPPKDFDYLVVGSSVEEMLSLGYELVGADFPVFLHPISGDEYALARIERKISGGYCGFSTEIANITLEEDLYRRDLTINSLAQCIITGEIFDPYNGKYDLKNKILRHTSAAFTEDPLRIIRLLRFYNRYTEFTIAPETLQLAVAMVIRGDLNQLSHERYWAELTKLFSEPNNKVKFFNALYMIAGEKYINFFKNLFDESIPKADIIFLVSACDSLNMCCEDSLTIFLAAVCIPIVETLKGATKRIQKATEGVAAVFKICDFTPEEILALAKKLGAFSQGDLFFDVKSAVQLKSKLKSEAQQQKIDWLFTTIENMKLITSKNFQHLSGREIGLAMDKSRIKLTMENKLFPIYGSLNKLTED